ncbi:peroxisomal acyl-coenzyme A oxidase 1-like [Palaemon carinicauda]|uniref:peroxisomal acyl-coenzyme A oxidase 1-like n=1 Tax=Palaemon carinicauda TaxID=392227 RepID=UPI0035B69BA8
MSSSWKVECVPDLKKERLGCSFDVEELTHIVDGGKDKTDLRRKLRKLVASDPAFKDEIPPEYLSHEDRYLNETRKSCYLDSKIAELGIDRKTLLLSKASTGILKDGDPLWIHYNVFLPAVAGQGDAEQRKEWIGRIEKREVLGTYAQTELGHGSFLRGLETTATYDPATQEFILHSPTITAAKWWPGGLANSSTHAAVMALLYSKDECHGPHMFLVPLRDCQTYKSLPGITLGEIGPRMGMNSNDNGFVRFENFRIPRRNMLMRYSQVLEDGTYVKPAHSKLSYGAMVRVRVGIARDVCIQLQQAVTIATRYSAVRRQSELVPGEPEPQILDYETQQYKILPQIASVFALLFSSRSVTDVFYAVSARMEEGDMSLLPELHALSSGIKALGASDASSGIEICRLACGGHGYMASSNLPRLYTGTTCAITYEGENTVLWLQVARYLVKSYRAAKKGNTFDQSVRYLGAPPICNNGDLSSKGLVEAFKAASRSLVASTEQRLQRLCDSGMEYHHAWNACSVGLVKCAEAHMRYYVCEKYIESVETESLSPELREVMRNLSRLYLTYHITRQPGIFLKGGALTGADISQLEEDMSILLASLRPQAVSIVDSFDFDDDQLNSTLGAWDGNVYQRLYDEAMKSPLNKKDVPEAYHKYLKPLMKSDLSSKL